MPQTDDPWGRQLIDRMVLLIKEELHHFWQVREVMQARNIPYVKITASRYAKGMLKAVRTHEPLTLIDKLICGAYIEARSCERFAALAPWLDEGFTDVLSLASALRSAALSGLPGAGAADFRRGHFCARALFWRGGS